jgi:predicted ATPase
MPTNQIIKRLTLRQFKSVEQCDFELSNLTLLVGRNGAGKSNIVDALAFVSDALRNTLGYALRTRGGIEQVRRKSPSKPTIPRIGIELSLPRGDTAHYSFEVSTVKGPIFRISAENCLIMGQNGQSKHSFDIRNGSAKWSLSANTPPVAEDRLYLVSASGFPEFRPVYDILTRMVFHNLNPVVMKAPQRPEPGSLLTKDGSNLASVLKQLSVANPGNLHRVVEFIQAIGAPIRSIEHKQAGTLETFEVLQDRGEEGRPAKFDAMALSDGTIRALGIFVSLFSVGPDGTTGPSLIGIEEPETALHPAAAGAMMEAMIEGSESAQILLTCHSPDLLDHSGVNAEMIRPVVLEDGSTRVGVLAKAKTELLKNHLSTAGELLRLDQLEPDPADLRRQSQIKFSWEDDA